MSLTKEFNNLRQQLDTLSETLRERLFDDLIGEQPHLGLLSRSGETPWTPAIELQETETEMVLKAQLPGIKPAELDIQVSENAVFLSGEYQAEKKTNEKGIFRSEFHYGQFKRVVPLPTTIQRERVTAKMEAGLLTLTMLKASPTLSNLVKVPIATADDKPPVLSVTDAKAI
jgi:HSP20 family protein